MTMVILEDIQFGKTEGNCLAPSYLNLNFINFIKGGVFTLFSPSFFFSWSELPHNLIVTLQCSESLNSFCFGKLVITENGRKRCI